MNGLISISRIQLMGHTSAGHGVSGTDLVGCLTSLDIPRASRSVPTGFNPEVPLLRRMPTRPDTLLEPLGYSPGLGSALKKGFVPHSSGWWDGRQIPLSPHESSKSTPNIIVEHSHNFF